MGVEDVRKLKEKMGTHTGQSKPSPSAPAGGGQVSGDVLSAPRTSPSSSELRKTGGVPSGAKSVPEKQVVAEDIVAEAKARDVADSREETRGDERHDIVDTFPPNIPPSIIQERLKMGQHPDTGEPWTREEEKTWRAQQEQARVDHAAAVAASEDRMRKEQSAPPTAIQPVTHVPTAHTTPGQRKAMQEVQDRGGSPVAQAQARDLNHPDELGRRQAAEMAKANGPAKVEGNEIDPELERKELGEDEPGTSDETENDLTQDADDVEADLNRPNPNKTTA